jgi:predicted nuclease with TOPRIM domain
MAEEIDLNFLGEQLKRLQADVRDLKTRTARTDADVLALNEQLAAMNEQMVTLNERLESLEGRVESGFDESRREFAVMRAEMADMRSEMTRNLELVLTAIREQRG